MQITTPTATTLRSTHTHIFAKPANRLSKQSNVAQKGLLHTETRKLPSFFRFQVAGALLATEGVEFAERIEAVKTWRGRIEKHEIVR